MEWLADAKKNLHRLPAFVRPIAKRMAEEVAEQAKRSQVEPEDLLIAKRQYLAKMGISDKGNTEFHLYDVSTCKGRERQCPFYYFAIDSLKKDMEAMLEEVEFSQRLEMHLRGFLLPPNRFMVALSGCPNSCAQEQIKDFGVCVVKYPKVTSSPCTNCAACLSSCLEDAIMIIDGRPVLDTQRCIRCGMCAQVCPTGSIVSGDIKFLISVGGKLGRHPQFSRVACECDSPDKVLDYFRKTIAFYLDNMRRGERLGNLLNRIGWHALDPSLAETSDLEDFLS